MISRRALISRAALLAAGGAGLWLVRDRLPWPPPRLAFANGRDTPWQRLPDRAGLIEIPVTVNGAAVRAVVDSGAQFTAIDAGLATRLPLPRIVAAPMLAYGVSGRPSLTHTVRLDLGVPGLAIPGLRAAALDLAAIAEASGRDFQVLIGRDVLSHVVVEADFPLGRARFLASGAYRPPRDAIAVPLRITGGGPMIPVQVEAAPAVDVLLDTGATGLLALSNAAARQAGLLAPGRQVSEGHSVSLGGLSPERLAVAQVVRIGGLALHDVGVQVYAPAANAPAPSGLLGTGLLRQFRMALDLAGQRLYLVPAPLLVVGLRPEPRP
ncbi:pepsin/retropepsin-like aspartic protease family protein [Phenylobacterium sp.]|uniref:pepsin/retropepsin-like aspartic protease family protein n=1 Tax=Phenylobacterium sp. TaxID=1871053 RepID=UPI0025EAE30B|nr:pepsin/retropepsin-like aspartic protease family protein [Phenylobacterium sp.]